MALRFTSEAGRVHIVSGAVAGDEEWPKPIRIGVLSSSRGEIMAAAVNLPVGVPIVVQLAAGQRYDVEELTRVAGVAGRSGRDLVVLLDDE